MTTTVTSGQTGPLTANGVTPLPFTFQSVSADEISVLREGVLADPSTYTVSRDPDGTGEIIPTSSWGSEEVYIYSSPDYSQPTNFSRFGAFYPDQVNTPLDRIARSLIALQSRSVLVPPGAPGAGVFGLDENSQLVFYAPGDFSGTGTGDPVVRTITSAATVVPTFAEDAIAITAQAADLLLDNPAGVVVPMKPLTIRIKDNGTSRAISYGTQYRAVGSVTLPSDTVPNRTTYLSLIYNSTDSKWDVVSVAAPVAASGILFDTSGDDNFTDLIYTPHASLTVTDGQVAFVSASVTDQVMTIAGPDGVTPLYHCFDNWTIDATFITAAFPAAGDDGAYAASRQYVVGVLDSMFGMRVSSHPGSAALGLIPAITSNSVLEYNSASPALPATLRVRYNHNMETGIVTHTVNINGGADIQMTEPYGGGSFAAPTSMMSAILRFIKGTLTCTELKFSAAFPNARFAFIGDSLTIWPTTGFTHLIRADYPGQVLIAGASGATTTDWEDMVHSVALTKPAYAFVCLGTNDRLLSMSVAASQASMQIVLDALVAQGVTPIIISSPPIGNANVPTFNTWLAGLGYGYIDIYTSLKNPASTALSATYDNGDGIHWNPAGHTLVKGLVEAYITAQGL